MKKLTLILSLFSLCMILSAKPVLLSESPCEYMETFVGFDWNEYKSMLTYEELSSDINQLCYYLRNAYADYEGMCGRGFSASELKYQIFVTYSKNEKIDTRAAFKFIADFLEPFISDRYFSIITKMAVFEPVKSSRFFYTNTFVEKSDDGFYLLQSDSENLSKGMKFDGASENLFYYPVKGKNVWRIGIISVENPKILSVQFEGKSFLLPVYDDGAIQTSSIRYHELESDDSVYASLSSFWLPEKGSQFRKGADIVLSKYASLASKYYDKKNIIIDLRGNPGGVETYSEYLFYSLYTNNKKEFSWKKLSKYSKWFESYISNEKWIESPVTLESYLKFSEMLGFNDAKLSSNLEKSRQKPVRKIFGTQKRKPLEKNKKAFPGKIIILIDRNSLSASENTVVLAKKLFGDNAVIIGEKTGGCCEYWNNIDYMLPDSKVCVHFGSQKNAKPEESELWHGEGFGIYPDYWSIGEDLNDTIFLVTDDSKMKEKLAEIDSRLM